MARRKREVTIADELVDELLKNYREPADLLGESGIIQQLTQRLVERALAGELTVRLSSRPKPTTCSQSQLQGKAMRLSPPAVAIVATATLKRLSSPDMESWNWTFLETAMGSLNQFWCPNMLVGSPDSTKRFWRCMPVA
jgi:hypothetical protein